MWFSVSRGTETQPGLTEGCANRIIPTPASKAPFSAIVKRERKNLMSEYFFKRIENIFSFLEKKKKKDPHREKFWLTFNIFQ